MSLSRNVKIKLIFGVLIILLLISLFFNGYFSESVTQVIVTQAKINSQDYIGEILKEEITNKEIDLFYDSVSTDGVVISSFMW